MRRDPAGSPHRSGTRLGGRCIVCERVICDDELAWWTPALAGLLCSRACCATVAEVGRQFFERMPRRRARPSERKDDDPMRARYA